MNRDSANNWQQFGNWKDGRARSGARTMIWISLVFGVAFTGLSLPAVLAIPEELSKGNYAVIAVLLFPLVGLSALGLFIYAVLAWRKFGITEVLLDPVPGSIGGDFGGRIETRIPYSKQHRFNITLNCQHLRTTGSGKNRSTKTTTRWQREGVATTRRLPGGGTEIAFRFEIPHDLPPSEPRSNDCHQWLLQIDCELPGIDFKRSFVVPVITTATPLHSGLRIPYARDSAPLQQPPPGTVRITPTTDGIRFYYPWHRHLWPALLMFLVGSFFVVIGYLVGRESGEIMFPVVFGGLGGTLALAGLYMMGNTLTATVSREGIHTVRNIFGFRFQRRAARETITRLERSIVTQMQSGARHRVYYRISAHTRDKRRITIADTLEGSRLADFIENRVRVALWPETSRQENDLELVFG